MRKLFHRKKNADVKETEKSENYCMAAYQQEIERIAKQYISNPPSVDTRTDVKEIDRLRKICLHLMEIFKKNFRPHYFFVHGLINELDLTESRLLEVHSRFDLTLTYLKTDDCIEDIFKNVPLFNDDILFQIQMFFAAIEYEVRLKTDALKTMANANKIQDLDQRIKSINTTANGLDEKIKIATDEAHNLLANAIAILGIFIAIVTVIFGGEEFIQATISGVQETLAQNLGNNSAVFVSILLIILLAAIIINIIFMFAYILSRLIVRDIGMLCRYHKYNEETAKKEKDNINHSFKSCTNCEHRCSFYQRLKYRFPYIFYMEIALLTTLMGFITIWIAKSCVYDPLLAYTEQRANYFWSLKSIFGIMEMGVSILIFVFIVFTVYKNKVIADGFREEKKRDPKDIVFPAELRNYKRSNRINAIKAGGWICFVNKKHQESHKTPKSNKRKRRRIK